MEAHRAPATVTYIDCRCKRLRVMLEDPFWTCAACDMRRIQQEEKVHDRRTHIIALSLALVVAAFILLEGILILGGWR